MNMIDKMFYPRDQLLKKYSTDISYNLKHLLDMYSMSILELSTKSGISYSAVHKLVNNAASPNLDSLIKISRVFNINVSQLIGELPIMNNNEPSFTQMVPIIEWKEVQEYLHNSAQQNKEHYKLLPVSSKTQFEGKTFALLANNKTEPIFKTGIILIFDQIISNSISDLEKYDNQFILVSSLNNLLNIKKLFVNDHKIFLQSIHTDLQPLELNSDFILIAHLIQAKMDFN